MLRSFSLAVAAVVSAVVLGAVGSAAGTPLATGSVVGGGVIGDGFGYFSISAKNGPNGDFGRASVTYKPPGSAVQFWDIDVHCVNVVGNTAFVTGTVVRVWSGDIPGATIGFLLKDGGNASQAPVDGFTSTFGWAGMDDVPPSDACHLISGPYFSFTNVTAGNITIAS